jgi:carbonic anhydrase/acetyltransferase-like protein (isoleucine patch superfamily)
MLPGPPPGTIAAIRNPQHTTPMAIYQLDDHAPQVHPEAYVVDSATVIGRVVLAARVGVWFHAVIRGDNEAIIIGEGSNVQDGAILHVDPGFPLAIGRGVTVGHQAMVHGCTIGDGSLIGIQAVVMNGAVLGRQCLVGAGAVVTEGKTFPDRSLILGSPAKAVRTLSDEHLEMLRHAAENYSSRIARYRGTLKRLV